MVQPEAGPPIASIDRRRLSGVDQNDFVLDSDDLNGRQIRCRRTIPRLDADATEIDRAGAGTK
jgi:hypothetical protein